MAKRLFYSCRSPSAAAAVSPTTKLLPTAGHPPVVPAPSGAVCCPRRVPRRCRRRRAQTPAACGAGGCAVDYGADDLPSPRGTPAYRWLRSSRWHVIEAASAYASDGDGDDTTTPRLKIDARRRVRRHSRRPRRVLHRRPAGPASWSSGDSGWFSSDDDDDDSDGDVPFGAAREGSSSSAVHVAAAAAAAASTTTTTESSSTTGASRPSSAARGGERQEGGQSAALAGGFAVVKRSDDPRADFRRSMAEMVVGRGIYDADGLERLLRCFLALNDRRHRRDIVAAFGDVWEAVFSDPPSSQSHHSDATAAAAASASSSEASTLRAEGCSHASVSSLDNVLNYRTRISILCAATTL